MYVRKNTKTRKKLEGWVRRTKGVMQTYYGRPSNEQKDKIRQRFEHKPYV